MMRTFRSALVIARRDYVATVWSKTFLIFLIGPLLPLIFGIVASLLSGGKDASNRRDAVALTMPADNAVLLTRARGALARRIGDQLPLLDRHPPAQGQASLNGTLDHPRLQGAPQALKDLGGPIGLILDSARADRALGDAAPPPVDLQTAAIQGGAPNDADRADLAKVSQFILFFLTFLIASMLVSNLVEEKANKIIELLASAVPVDAIFMGKLIAMLGATLSGMVVWATCAAIGIGAFVPAGAIPTPAIGWPFFIGLALTYFVMLFLLWGVLYLGIGAQAGSAREAQTLAMPLSLAQALIFTFASAQASHPDRPIAIAAAIFPWSSPFAMLARGAMLPALWPHLAALALQFCTLLIAIRLGAKLFRTNILKTGRPAGQPNRIARFFTRRGE